MKKLKSYMARNNLSAEMFARRIRKPAPSLYAWLRGSSTPALKTAIRIEKATKGEVTVYDWCQ